MSTTVVTALFNGEPWIGETLDSVARQTRRPAQHWIVDDGSTDGSVRIASGRDGVTLTRNPGKGPNAARAFAIEQSRSDYVAVLDQDDVWHPAHLALLEEALEKNPRATAAFAGVHRFYTGEEIVYRPEPGVPCTFDPWAQFPMNAIAAPAQVLIRREALLATRGWPTHIVGLADFFAWLVLSVRGPFLSLPSLTVGYRQHADSYSKALRQEKGRRFFERHVAAAAEALSVRQAHGESKPDNCAGRLELYRLMFAWLELLQAGPRKESREITQKLDTELGRHPPQFVTELWSQIFYFVAPVPASLQMLNRGWWLLRLYARAPHSAQSLRRSLRAVIARNLRLAAQKLTPH